MISDHQLRRQDSKAGIGMPLTLVTGVGEADDDDDEE
jgi:hypothetical protein